MADTYKIECYVETVSSDGNVTVRGVDGYRLEKKEGEKEKTYNVFWKVENAGEVLVKVFPVEENLLLVEKQFIGKSKVERRNAKEEKTEKVFDKELQFLLTAKANHLKVSLDVALGNAEGKDNVLIQKISLL